MSQFYENPKGPEEQEAKPLQGQRDPGKGQGRKTPRFFPSITGRKRIGLYVYTALTVLAAIIVMGYVAFEAFSAPPVVETNPPRPPQTTTTTDPEGNMIDIVINPEIMGPSSDRKDQFYTFLMVGQSQEEGGSLTDTIILAAYDVPNQTLNVMSIPRDIYVRRNNRRYLINSIYNVGGGTKGNGKEALKEEVTKMTGIPVDFFVVLKWEAFGELVDAIGGVYYDVPRDMKYKDPEQNLYIDVKKGYQLLDGDKAMQVVRFREGANGYVDGDLGRIRTQQGFLKELVKKCIQPDVLLSNLAEYIEIFQKNVTTDLDVSALTYFGKSAIGGLDMDNVTFVTMPNKPATNGHLYPDAQAIVELVNEGFNPYREDVELWELTVESGSSSGTSTTTSTPKPSATPSPTPADTPAVTDTPEPSGGQSSARPSSSRRPAETDLPVIPGGTENPGPSDSPAPAESQTPDPETTPTPQPTPMPEATPAPTPEEEAPMLPPGPVG